jgi:DNA-binding CsgD family transcriptional regulator
MRAAVQVGQIQNIAASFSAATFEPSLWEKAMDTAAEATGSVGSVLLPIKGRVPGVPVSPSVAEMISTYFREGWSPVDQRARGLPAMLRRGVMSDLDFLAEDELGRSPYYQDFLGRFGLRWFAGIKVAAGDDIWCLAIQRSIQQGPFTSGELSRLSSISGRLSATAEVAQALGLAREKASLEAFHFSGRPVAMLDRNGEVTNMNGLAERLLSSPSLRVKDRRIVAADSDSTVTLNRGIRTLLWNTDDPPPTIPLVIRQPEGRPILAYPSRLPEVALDCFTAAQLAIVFVDLNTTPTLVSTDLKRIFGLTPAESRFARHFLAYQKLDEVAEQTDLAYETCRNMLKRVFHKTGTHRQAELINLLHKMSALRTTSQL